MRKFQPGDLVMVVRTTGCKCETCRAVWVGMPGTVHSCCLMCSIIHREIAYHVDFASGRHSVGESYLKKIDDPDAGVSIEREASRPREVA